MNVPIGGHGKTFNGNDCVDGNGNFGHMYMRVRKGDKTHCGAILVGMENAQPKKESCIGQLHNYKAISHDMSSFFSGKKSPGKTIGGRETDLSHISPKDLTKALEQFDAGYRELQRRAAGDASAMNRLKEINNKLSGKRMSAPELTNLMTGLGLDKETAIRTAVNGRSAKNNRYGDKLSEYSGEMQEISAKDLDKVKDPPVDSASVDRMREISGMSSYVDSLKRQWLSMEDHTLFRSLNSKEFNSMEKAFRNYLSAYDNVISGKTPDGKHKRSDPA